MSSSGVRLRPRHGRIAAFLAAASTTLVSFVGAVVADGLEGRTARSAGAALTSSSTATGTSTSDSDGAAAAALATAPSTAVRAALSVGLAAPGTSPGTAPPTASPTAGPTAAPTAGPTASPTDVVGDDVPQGSGTGRRVVFSEFQQQVWLVEADEEVARTYLVSGSVFDNLDPGTYEVYSRSRTATGIDGSDLRYMVRFTQGENAAIGFHSIPRVDGRRVQTRAELGTPLSHGCIRQALPDARALWRFAPVGTTVVVTA